MKRLDSNGTRRMLVGFIVVAILSCCAVVRADFVFGEATNLGPGINSTVEDGGPCISPDGLELYFYSFLEGWAIPTLRVATRETTKDPWGEAVGLESPLKRGTAPSFSADGLELYFESERSGGFGGADIWMAARASLSDLWAEPINLGSAVNSPDYDMAASVSADGLELYFGSLRPGGSGDWDVWISTRETVSEPWSKAKNLGPTVNSPVYDGHPFISPDGLALFITSARSGGYGDWDIWMTRRATRYNDWSTPVNLGPSLNTNAGEAESHFSADGRTLYISDWWVTKSGGAGKADLWQVPILPVVDFTGDYKVDIEDLIILIEHWGQNEPSLDMGPMPWGDGVIDAADLEVLMSYWDQELDDPHFIAHWALDETEGMFATESVNGKNGFVLGNPVWQPEGGQVGGALAFDGIDDMVTTTFMLNPEDGPFSVLAWVRGGEPGQVILSQQKSTNWLQVDAQGTLMTELAGSGRTAGPLYSETTITDGNWHRVGLVRDGSQRMLYVDGILVAVDDQSSLKGSTASLVMGVGQDNQPDTFWAGMIDDVRIYDRVVVP